MSTWTTTETRTETKERSWSLVVWDNIKCAVRWTSDGGSYPSAADYIAALRAEPEEVRAEVIASIVTGCVATVIAERAQARDALATVTAERDELARLDKAVKAIAAEGDDTGAAEVSILKNGTISLQHSDWRASSWTTITRVLAAIAREQPKTLLAAADKLRLVAHCDGSEPTVIVGEWDGDAIVYPGGSCRPVREAGFVGIEVVSCGHANWLDVRNALALLSRAGLLPKATTDRETRAILALADWAGYWGKRKFWRECNGNWYASGNGKEDPWNSNGPTALDLCANLGIEVL